MMALSESDRFELHLGLQKILGEPLATTFMENVPPSGWSEVAQKSDLVALKNEMNFRFAQQQADITNLRIDLDRVKADLARLDKKLNVVISVGLTFGLALLALQVQIMLSIAQL
jgi:hypothetical protein